MTALTAVAPTPWRNGGGTTRELLAWPSSSHWQLRLSVADIASDGAFSAYPGVQRWFALLSGVGVGLHWPDGSTTPVTPGSGVLPFDGATPPTAQLINGPVQDLNLMSRQPHAGLVPVQAHHPWTPPPPQQEPAPHGQETVRICGLFTPVAGQLSTGPGVAQPLPALSLYHCIAPAAHRPHPWTFVPQHPTDRLGWWFHFQSAPAVWETPLP